MLLEEDLSYQIRGAVFEVSRYLGHRFLERIYEGALLLEFKAPGLRADGGRGAESHVKKTK